jgi:hypothetical protein
MKLSGTKDLDVALDKSAVTLTLQFKTPYEAAIAYDELSTHARNGDLKLNLRLGEVIDEEGPQVR